MFRLDGESLHNLFMSALGGPKKHCGPALEILEKLIRATLDYRDCTLAEKGRVVTVQDVRLSLDWLVPCLSMGNVPDRLDPVCIGLLERWLEALRRSPRRTHFIRPL